MKLNELKAQTAQMINRNTPKIPQKHPPNNESQPMEIDQVAFQPPKIQDES